MADKLDWNSITEAELKLFFDELVTVRNYHVRTIRRIHSVLRQIALYQRSIGSTELQAMIAFDPPELTDKPLLPTEWVTNEELVKLLRSLSSENGLSQQQLATFPFYKERNLLIVRLFAYYGLTLQHVQRLSMDDVKFERDELHILDEGGGVRAIKLGELDKKLAYTYYTKIPEPVRPRYHSNDPFFIAFDFKRKTFHWSYDDDQPKRMSMIAIQKMVRIEVKRAQLRKGISAQTFRHTFILKALMNGGTIEQTLERIGYSSPLSLRRYENTIMSMTKKQKAELIGNPSASF